MAKTYCKCCNKKYGIKLDCKFCNHKFCTYCLMPEKHKCDNIVDCKRKSRDLLEDELMSNKCVKKKIESI